MIQVGDGGSGPYRSVLVGDPNLKTHTLYRPRDLTVFGANFKLPVVAYGNGACRNASYEVRNFLTEVASHGFLVVAIGPVIPTIAGGAYVSGPTKSAQLLDAVDWATAENARQGSELYGKVDTSKVAVMGHSCGGLQAIEVSTDPRVTTTVMLNRSSRSQYHDCRRAWRSDANAHRRPTCALHNRRQDRAWYSQSFQVSVPFPHTPQSETS